MLSAPTLGRDLFSLSISALAPGSYILRAQDGAVLGRFVKE